MRACVCGCAVVSLSAVVGATGQVIVTHCMLGLCHRWLLTNKPSGVWRQSSDRVCGYSSTAVSTLPASVTLPQVCCLSCYPSLRSLRCSHMFHQNPAHNHVSTNNPVHNYTHQQVDLPATGTDHGLHPHHGRDTQVLHTEEHSTACGYSPRHVFTALMREKRKARGGNPVSFLHLACMQVQQQRHLNWHVDTASHAYRRARLQTERSPQHQLQP